MPKDPVVEEVHRIREELLKEYGGIDGYLRHLEELRTELKDRIVTRSPRKPITTKQKTS